MTTSTDDLEKRMVQLKRLDSTRSMERHPTILKNVSDLPAELQSPPLIGLVASQVIQAIISFSQQIQRGHHDIPKQALLFAPTAVIHVLT
jgi:hypothetical protein